MPKFTRFPVSPKAFLCLPAAECTQSPALAASGLAGLQPKDEVLLLLSETEAPRWPLSFALSGQTSLKSAVGPTGCSLTFNC